MTGGAVGDADAGRAGGEAEIEEKNCHSVTMS